MRIIFEYNYTRSDIKYLFRRYIYTQDYIWLNDLLKKNRKFNRF